MQAQNGHAPAAAEHVALKPSDGGQADGYHQRLLSCRRSTRVSRSPPLMPFPLLVLWIVGTVPSCLTISVSASVADGRWLCSRSTVCSTTAAHALAARGADCRRSMAQIPNHLTIFVVAAVV